MKEQARVYYSGRVQGVGFRFTASSLAREFNIKGWVKNLPDGRVEIIAVQGREELEKFLKEIYESFKSYIVDLDTQWSGPDRDFVDFEVKF